MCLSIVSLLLLHLRPVFCRRPSASSTPLGVTRSNPCTSAHWSGMSGCLATPTPHTGYEPTIFVYANDEHTLINLPDINRNFPRNYAATLVSTTEDPERTSTFRSIRGESWKCGRGFAVQKENKKNPTSSQETGARLDASNKVPKTKCA